MKRREFIKGALAGSGLAALSTMAIGGQAENRASSDAAQQMSYGVLGRTGVKVSRLGVGCGSFSSRLVSADEVGNILRRAVDLGVNYIDTAPNYGDAEEQMGPTIKELRDKIFLVTKTEEGSREGTWRLIRRSLRRLQTDHLDMVHMHHMGNVERFPDVDYVLSDKGALGALREAKKQGVIRYIGATAHNYPARLHKILDTGEIDVLMNAVNFVVQHTYDFEHKVWCRAREEKVGLVAMKILGGRKPGGNGFRLPEDTYEQAIRYALSIPGISCAVIGFESVAELEKAAETVSRSLPLSEEESAKLYRQGIEILTQDPDWKMPYGAPMV